MDARYDLSIVMQNVRNGDMNMIKKIKTKLRKSGNINLLHDSKQDVATLMAVCNELIDKVNELVDKANASESEKKDKENSLADFRRFTGM
ncbi:MAG: hypothetical protein WC375_10245 [Methanomassiliicoccales archaeon]|jgi:hypothetical protein